MKLTLNPYQNYLELKNYIYLKKYENCENEQKKLLLEIISKNKKSKFGKINKFNKIKNIETFQNFIKISNFDKIEKFIENEKTKKKANSILSDTVEYFAITSGTTNTPKFIPHTINYIKKRQKAWEVWNHSIYNERPKTYSLTGSILLFTSRSYDGFTKSHVPYGSVTGKIHDLQLPILKMLFALPDEISEIDNFETKYYLNVIFSIQKNLTLIATPNPSTLLIYAKTIKDNIDQIITDLENNYIEILENNTEIPRNLKETLKNKFSKNKTLNYKTAQKLKQLKLENKIEPKYIFTNLQTIGCWTKGHVKIYLKQVIKHFGENVMIRDTGYMASEGRFTIPIETKKNGEGILDIQTNFYEFIKLEDYDKKNRKTYLAHQLKINEKYYILITNENGLYRYDLNDIIEVTGYYKNTQTPMITFVQKGKYFSSITGEKISEWEIINTVQKLEKTQKIHIQTFFVMPEISVKNPQYKYYIEFDKTPNKSQILKYEKMIEDELQKENIEYKEKRESKRLKQIKIIILPKHSVQKIKNTFSKGKNKDIQIKEPKLIVLDKDIKIINTFLKEHKIK